MDPLEVFDVVARHLDQVVGVTRHQMTAHDLGAFNNGGLEGIENLLRLAGQGDLHEHRGGLAHRPPTDQGDIALDHPLLLQRPHPAQCGRR